MISTKLICDVIVNLGWSKVSLPRRITLHQCWCVVSWCSFHHYSWVVLMRVCSNRTEENHQLHLFNIVTSLLRIVCSQVDTLRMDNPNNFTTRLFCHINGVISPVHGVHLSSGKKHCVSKEEYYKKRESLNWANLTFNLLQSLLGKPYLCFWQ